MGGTGSGARRWLWVAAALLILAAVAVFVVAPLTVDTDGFKKASEREQAKNNARTTMVQFLGLLGLAVGAAFTARTYHLNRQGQITDRMTKAVDQLGNENVEVRTGGTYALERIARESPEDRRHIVETLMSILRGAPRGGPTADGGMSVDRQAALRVLGRMPREEGLVVRLALHGADLRGANMTGHPTEEEEGRFWRSDLAYAQLEGADLRHGSFMSSDFSDAHLEGANFDKADLSLVQFDRVSAQGASFKETTQMPSGLPKADLQGAVLDDLAGLPPVFGSARLEGALIRKLRLPGAYLNRTSLAGASIRRVDLEGANLSEAVLQGAHLYEVNLAGADLRRAVLCGARLSDVNLAGADLSGATLDGVELWGTTEWPEDFDALAAGAERKWEAEERLRGGSLPAGIDARGARLPEEHRLESGDLEGALLRGAWLQAVVLSKAALRNADLRGAHLANAKLHGAQLADADLRGADLSDADLTGASIIRADLRGANLAGTDLSETLPASALLAGAKYDRHTIWPRNFEPAARGAVPRGRMFEP